jgi:NADH-quinone oxidoreductase subunit J
MDPVFASAAAVGIGSALFMVTRRNPVYAAVWLLVAFLSVAVIFLKLAAPFLAAVHVLVYTGAILVLFLFVIMLLNLKPDELGEEYPAPIRVACGALCLGLYGMLAVPIAKDPTLRDVPAVPEAFGSVESVGRLLFTSYALPFELVSVLIIVAMFGALVLAKRRLVTSSTHAIRADSGRHPEVRPVTRASA